MAPAKVPGGDCTRGARDDDDIHRLLHQLIHQVGVLIDLSLGTAIFDDNVVTVDPTELTQAPTECLDLASTCRAGQIPDAWKMRRWVRARGQALPRTP